MSNPFRSDFPVLMQPKNGKRLAYLDSAATTQKPASVMAAVDDYYRWHNANPHRGAYALSVEATEMFEAAREKVARFIGAASPDEVVFTKSTTESLNALAYAYGLSTIHAGDKIVIAITEHHSNLVPWQYVAKARGAELVYLYTDEYGMIPNSEIDAKIDERTRIVSIGHVSNAWGVIHPVARIIARAHEVGAIAIVDEAQSIPHMKVDMQATQADFAVFSGHKMLAEMGVGVLCGKKEHLEAMPPFLFGGDMIEYVSEQETTFAPPPSKFEGGTQNVGAAVSLAAAIDYLEAVGMERVEAMEQELTQYAMERMATVPHVKIYGPPPGAPRAGIISFNIDDCHPHDVSSILDADGVNVRSGHHCAQPLMKFMGVNATCRASFYLYNDKEDVDAFIDALGGVRKWLGHKD